MLDLLLQNGSYPDFEAGKMERGDVGIENGRIAYLGTAALGGDVNNDGNVTIADVTALVNLILGKDDSGYNRTAADVNNDGSITIADVTALVNLILGKN